MKLRNYKTRYLKLIFYIKNQDNYYYNLDN